MIFNNKFRLIISQNLSSNDNTNIDKALFKAFENESLPILRLYSWQKSVTFGAGQNPSDYENLLKEYKNNFSKRITGGGVLFHGHDISYSLILPSTFIDNRSVKETYELICSFILEFYSNLGLKASFAKDIKSIVLSKSPFCQVGFEAYDIIVNGRKIGGNAQKRAKNVIFQHGSIPIKSIKNDEKYGASLEDFSINLDFDEAINKLKEAFEQTFNAQLLESQLNENELNIYNEL
ncbi:lipoate--protein ligase family protein [Aliarcobacter butzleri]|uniref:lipoate--protein ligase family protein n=1 Tax=Aliarcobacter butzleri TaxID=28197 RepID=UPI0021B15D62|nr:lipoate--protein ligase family protein [Aliarcobacter butzleri]MCT7562118.1 lipoate--protein ligase family protein [Aliarcobacter butzleri]MCT7639646.1 lipoate--protein ligase family protein [Aliarcobacter butzleri]UWY59491.1 lipoate--protein ligase family protein [Aliarcobacter butzleri]